MTPTLSLAIIARDRGKELKKALDSVARFVDEIVVVDAGGSTDDTIAVARSFGAKVIEFLPSDHPEAFFDDTAERFGKFGIPEPFTGRKALGDFSAPRNVSFEACTKDFILWLDSDDVVVGGENLKEALATIDEKGFDCLMLDYDYSHDNNGNVIIKQMRERIVRRGTASWKNPIHEFLAGSATEKKVAYNQLVKIKHMHEGAKTSVVTHGDVKIVAEQHDAVFHRNLKNLLVHVEHCEAKGKEVTPELVFYLGNEWRLLDLDKALDWYGRYFEVSTRSEERALARFYVGQIREAQKKWEMAWNFMAGAAMDFPSNPAPWFALARIALVRGDWKDVITYSERGLIEAEKGMKDVRLLVDPYEAKYRALLPYTRALLETGQVKKALELCNQGLSVAPECSYLSGHKLRCLAELGKEELS